MQGLILINKPNGITSFGVCAKIRKLANEKRVGHTGTLDPLATGVLPVLIGRATALSSYLTEADKFYRATIKLGISTDTDDITGNILSENSVDITENEFLFAVKSFIGKQMQIPPSFSAIKQNGVPVYKLARQNKDVLIPAREVTVYSIDVIKKLSNTEFVLDIKCSKGTYIRSLLRDIGDYLGCKATMTALERLSTAGFNIEDTIPLEKISSENIGKYILPSETAVLNFGEIFVTPKQAVRFANGGELSIDRLNLFDYCDGKIFRVKYKDIFIGLGEICLENKVLKTKCVINNGFEV